MEKLALMQNLNLAPDSAIYLLISGINSRSLREIAASLNSQSIDAFLDSMHQITSVSRNKNMNIEAKSIKSEDVQKTTGKITQEAKTTNRDEMYCYCKIPRHSIDDCFKRRRKKQSQAAASSTSSTIFPAPSATVSTVEVTMEDHTVALVHSYVDTGSPISFVKSSIYYKFYQKSTESLELPILRYKALNNKSVTIYGTINSKLTLEQLPNQLLEIYLHVLKDDNLAMDLILSRDFLNSHDITAVYRPATDGKNLSSPAFPKALLQVLACSETTTETIDANLKI
ncbi:hypothetical protein ALC56_09459 [Trachymyrmex septentrionalis]|uniref:Uncharacterized protein n=1 Tax=Trachymyrmex septentrionalis TaxID=34720 RepID=A0A151JUF4_9HYME|nr:hypothetical protein ALC56_09459 [Trachymyrmex septentrionalis]